MNWLQIFQDPNIRWILLGSMILGLGSGVIGCFAYLRKQSLLGDALAHATLPGVCLAFLITGSRSIFHFLIGAFLASLVATFLIGYIKRNTRLKQDASLGIVLSVFFGLGIVLLTHIQHSGAGNQSGLDTFIFGQIASMVRTDVYTIGIISFLLILICAIFFKEFKLLSFDPGFAKGLGLPVVFLDQFMMLLIVVAVVIGIQVVGVVLMVALLITPAVAARYWTDKLHVMIIISGGFGLLSGLIGSLIGITGRSIPTGPVIVLVATCLFILSLLFAPKRGIVAKILLRKAVKREIVG